MNGRRVTREGFISIPRRNGKTGLVSGLVACHLCGPEAVQRGQVASAAAERDQAAIIFDELCAIISLTPWMMRRLIIRSFKKEIEDSVTGTTYKALSSDSKTKHGKGYSFWIYDELAQAHDRKLYDVLSTSGGSWDEPLGIVMSTQNDDPRHIMSELYDSAEQIQNGIIVDPSQQVCIYSAPMESDWKDEKTWYACNPALGDFRSLEDMRMLARKAERMPSSEATFRLLYLNQRFSADTKLIPRNIWANAGCDQPLEAMKGFRCLGAIDLSGSGHRDLTAMVLLFEDPSSGSLYCFPFFWCLEEGLEEAEGRDRVPYRLWAKQGHLIAVPGRAFGYREIAKQIGELHREYKIETVAVDPWNIEKLVAAIDEEGFDLSVIKHGQNMQDMSPAVTAMESDVLSGKLKHNRNPVLSWCIDNIRVTLDSSGNRKLDKRTSKGRIDGAVALAMACGLAARESAPKEPEYQMIIL